MGFKEVTGMQNVSGYIKQHRLLMLQLDQPTCGMPLGFPGTDASKVINGCPTLDDYTYPSHNEDVWCGTHIHSYWSTQIQQKPETTISNGPADIN